MKGIRYVVLLALMISLQTFAGAAYLQAQQEEAEAIKYFLSAQKSGGDDPQSVGSAIADLDGDGKPEMVLLWVLLGPTYSSNTLTVFSKTVAGYQPVASLPLDGIATKLSAVKAGIILVDQELFARKDPRCCPSIKKQLKYRWSDKKISEVKPRARQK